MPYRVMAALFNITYKAAVKIFEDLNMHEVIKVRLKKIHGMYLK